MNTHIHTHKKHTHRHTYTHAHKDTRMHARVRLRAPTHTKCSFVVRGPSLWNHLPDNIKKAGSVEQFKQILKTVVFSQSFENRFFLNFVTVPLTLVKYDAKCPTSSHNTPVFTCIQCMESSEKYKIHM